MARHTDAAVAPTNGEYVDGAQGVHATPPCPLCQVPAGHATHRLPAAGATEPGAQFWQLGLPFAPADEDLPAGHFWHVKGVVAPYSNP